MISTELFARMKFSYPFRKYQSLILAFVEEHAKNDNKYHIVAPPGSGKTIVGIELIRRTNAPAVIFSPTTTIQVQWKDKVSLFLSETDKDLLTSIVSTSPRDIKPINTFTYQSIATPGENVEFIEETAVFSWKKELLLSGMTGTEEEAQQRISTLKKNNAPLYKKELAKYYKRAKDEFLTKTDFDGTKLLHKNARDLIQNLVDAGVKTIIMDESHHLLDYWALILKELLKRIENPILIGLTATPPIGAEEEQMENYISLLGDVDFEIPTPAVVKEGNLAPYQDLVYFTFPTETEKQFIKSIQDTFDTFLRELTNTTIFAEWHTARFYTRTGPSGKSVLWQDFFKKHLALAIAGIKYALRENISIPSDIPIIEEMESSMTIEDWTTLLGDFATNYLATSVDPKHHALYKEIAKVCKSFGFTLTEKGIRPFRAPTDRILSLSESKNTGVIAVLTQEISNLKENTRAVVITDFELESPIVTKSFDGILPKGAGSALRVYETIVTDKYTSHLDPILVTGSRLLIEAKESERLLPAMNAWKDSHGYEVTLTTKQTEVPHIYSIEGKGKDWKPSTYVRMVTSLFESGITKCLVGTRGLLAEGWDTLSLNTLIDLTTATTSMMVQQIRGRSLRLNPSMPNKVANNWDIVCIEPHFEKGDQDFRRFLKKHWRFYGLTENGSIQKGVGHVDSQLFMDYSTFGFKKLQYMLANSKMLAKSRQRDKIYSDWKIGEEYQNFEYSIVKLDPKSIHFKTAYSLKDSLRAIFNTILTTTLLFFFQYLLLFGQIGTAQIPIEFLLICSGIFLLGVTVVSIKALMKYITKAFIELPIDSFVLDIGKCVLKSLRESGFVAGNLSVDNVRVVSTPEHHIDVYLDYATTEDTATFTQALQEVLSPVTNQRYIVYRSEADIKMFPYSTLWFILRKTYGLFFEQDTLAYHPVPTILSTHKKFALNFAQNWKMYVGGGHIIYTRSRKGLQILLRLRKKRNQRIRKIEMKYWK